MVFGSTASTEQSTKIIDEMNLIMESQHTVFVEVGTAQICEPCHDWNQNLHDAYISGDYDFEYVEMIVYDHNGQKLIDEAYDWAQSYNILMYPTSIFDGDFQRITGNSPELLSGTLDTCEARTVADITADMTLSWLGDATIQVDITIENNEATQYNGHIRACITEIVSRYDTYYGEPYHFGFLDYAFNQDITISARGTYTDTVIWDGNEHQDNHGDDFGDIDPDNIQVTMGVISNNNGFVDETVMARIAANNNPPNEPNNPFPPNGGNGIDVNADLSWSCSDPDGDSLTYDIYFRSTNPPPQVVWRQSEKSYDPGEMDLNTTHYWKIVAWDEHDASTSGSIWSFTIKEESNNQAPELEIVKPQKALYIDNNIVFPRIFRLPLIIGSITIEVNATDEDSGVERVEFYINGKLMENDTTAPYTYYWEMDRLRIFHLFIIIVVAFDHGGEASADLMLVRKFGLMGVALGTAIPLLVMKLFIQPIYTCRIIKLNIREYYFGLLIPILIKSFAVLTTFGLLSKIFIAPHYLNLVLLGLSNSIIFLATVFFIGLNSEERNYFRKIAFSK